MFNLLLVDDSFDDVLLTREALKSAKLAIDITNAEDGIDAMAFMAHHVPDLVLLDINMPRMNGIEVLAAMRAEPRLRAVPVVVLTTSDAEVDVIRAYTTGANAYITKPVNFKRFAEIVAKVGEFYFTVVVLPSHTPD